MNKLALPTMVLMLGLVACGGAAAPASAPASSPSSPAGKPATSAPAKPLASAASGAPERDSVKLTYATAGGGQVFARLAADKGLFKKYGLQNVDVQYAQSSVSMAAMTAGQVDFDLTAGADVIQAVVSGAKLKLIAYFDKHSPYGIFGLPEVKTAADLKGKTVAIGKIGDTSDVGLRMGLKQLGIDAKDVKLLQTGNSPDRWAALSSKQVQAAILDEETFAKQAEAQGMHVLASMRDQPYAATALAVPEAYAQANPNTVTAVIRGLIDGVKYFGDPQNKDEVINVVAKDQKVDPKEPQVEANYTSVKNRLSVDPYPDREGILSILGALKDIDASRYANVTPEQIIDASFAEKVRAAR